MSYLAGLLLMYLQEADAFIMLYNLLDSHFLSSMYHVDLAQISKHFRIFEILFAEQLPLLYKHFRSLGISNEHYLLDWYLTLFIKQLKPPIASRVWDCYLIEGDIFIHFTALGKQDFLLLSNYYTTSPCFFGSSHSNGFVVHLVARPLSMREVRGSKPCESNISFFLFFGPYPISHSFSLSFSYFKVLRIDPAATLL
jgi:hypothetical protein